MAEKFIVPKHLALIPDGNRRWSRSHKLNLLQGYNTGIKKFVDFSVWLKNMGASSVTVWTLSTENIKNRSKRELNILYNLYIKTSYDKEIIKVLNDNDTKVLIIGNTKIIHLKVMKALNNLQKITRKNSKFTINLLIAYGGKEDIIYAIKHIVKAKIKNKITKINEEIIRKYIQTTLIPDPDLIIRTSGEIRTSGFLPWQSSYSELYFSKKYWPDFNQNDLKRVIMNFSKRQRRFGK